MENSNEATFTFQQLIDDGVLEIGDGYRAKNSELGGNGPMFLRAGHVTDSHIDFEGVERFHSLDINKLRPKMAQVGDTIITTKGNSTGRTSFVTDRMPPFVYSPHLSFWRSKDKDKIANGFLRYWSRGREFLSQLAGMKTSTDMAPYLSLTDQRRLRISFLPIADQQNIAHILGSLDDKIELNRRMNETLEGMAQALFKSWFVDFDPVIDNALAAGNPIPEELADRAEVRRAALADGTANREAAKPFPAAFQQTEELGWIPKGWRIREMSHHADILMGHSPKGETYNSDGDGIPLVNGPVEFGPYFTRKSKWTTSPTRLSASGDLVVCVRGSTTGRFVKSDGEYCLGRGVCSIRARRSQCFVDQLFRLSVPELLGLTTGSTFPNWSRPTLVKFETIGPPDSIVDAFDAYVAPNVERVEQGFIESESLTKLRDTLLPKLISGELRIPDAEKLGEAALA